MIGGTELAGRQVDEDQDYWSEPQWGWACPIHSPA